MLSVSLSCKGTLQTLKLNITSIIKLHVGTQMVQENVEGLELNGTHQLLAYVDDVNKLGQKKQQKGRQIHDLR